MIPDRELLFVSRRIFLLRAVTGLLIGQIALVAWLVSLAPAAEWRRTLGETFWWAVPAALVGLSLVLPLALCWLHDRYVLQLETTADAVCLTTFLLWGSRDRVLRRDALTTALTSEISDTREGTGATAGGAALRIRLLAQRLDLVFDREGEFPKGEDRILELFQKT